MGPSKSSKWVHFIPVMAAIKAKLKDIIKGEKEISLILHEITELQSDRKITQESLINMISDLKKKYEDINILLEFFKVEE